VRADRAESQRRANPEAGDDEANAHKAARRRA
jgi:hypothetical protein